MFAQCLRRVLIKQLNFLPQTCTSFEVSSDFLLIWSVGVVLAPCCDCGSAPVCFSLHLFLNVFFFFFLQMNLQKSLQTFCCCMFFFLSVVILPADFSRSVFVVVSFHVRSVNSNKQTGNMNPLHFQDSRFFF